MVTWCTTHLASHVGIHFGFRRASGNVYWPVTLSRDIHITHGEINLKTDVFNYNTHRLFTKDLFLNFALSCFNPYKTHHLKNRKNLNNLSNNDINIVTSTCCVRF